MIGITGSSGYVGQALNKILSSEYDFDFIHIGRTNSGYNKFIKFELGKEIPSPLPSLNTIVHIAAHIPRNQSQDNLLECEVQNGKGMLYLLDALNKTELQSFINISSCHIWSGHDGSIINNPYEGSKLSGEMLLNAFAAFYGFRAINLRLSYVYGPHMKHGAMFRIFIDNAINNKPIKLFNNGNDCIHLIHIDDVVRAIISTIQNDSITGTFDICNATPVTTHEIARIIIELTKSNSKIELVNGNSKPKNYELNPEKTEEQLHFNAQISLKKGIESLLKTEYKFHE